MTTATNIQENAEDVLAEAKEIDEQRKQEEVFLRMRARQRQKSPLMRKKQQTLRPIKK